MVTHEAQIKQLKKIRNRFDRQKKEAYAKLKIAEEELLRVKEICLRECGVGIVNEVVLAKIRETK